MGIDYAPVGGFTIKFDKGWLAREVARRELYDAAELFDDCELPYANVGCSLSGEVDVILIMQPLSRDVDKQLADWLALVNEKLGTAFTLDDVAFVTDLYIY